MSRISPRSSSQWKGKARALHSEEPRGDGTGGPAGIVLPLNMVGGGMYEAVYTVAVQVSNSNQNFSLQVDTGSSDLWIASTSCSSAACSGSKGRQYDPSVSGIAAGYDFSITYLAGVVTGPVYWDQLQVGGYNLSNQALAAATTVDSEPLEYEFDGILGLALPLNSIIAHHIAPIDGNGRDGAPFSSNLFGITPVDSAPASRFLSLSLSRPGSSAVPSLLGIGRHPSELVPDPSKIRYSTLVSEHQGILFWEAEVRAITVYVNGTTLPVELGHSRSGNVFPVAVLDSGVPFILAATNIANGIYGALGIGPAADGQYYVPCTTPLNMTITLDGQPEIPLHPLDVTTESQSDPSSSTCVGLIQTAGGQLDTSTDVDLILGVAFLRNVYTVMAYDNPDARGQFPPNGNGSDELNPRLGLLSLTNATQALQEFNNVRLLNQPLSSGNGGNTPSSAPVTSVKSGKLSVGVDVLLGLVGFIGACAALFGLRWFLVKRRLRRSGPHLDAATNVTNDKRDRAFGAAYQLADRGSSSSSGSDPIRARTSLGASLAGNSARTFVGQDDEVFRRIRPLAAEQGSGRHARRATLSARYRTSTSTLATPPAGATRSSEARSTFPRPDPNQPTRTSASTTPSTAGLFPLHRHTPSEVGLGSDTPAAVEPLLPAHARDSSVSGRGSSDDDDLAELGRSSMAGVGTAARSPRIRARHASSAGSMGSMGSLSLGGPHFPSIAPGQRLSAYSIVEGAPLPPPPLPPPP
ncbi:aspartic peptidase domain-containing protein [Lactarius akahatsu]|uniref:Aspartic peptidase domain-containing protein n=1 Tax=Lactarius akahatsu TaxID=416441 RepID=A0AAD4LAW9_9AGAM|nr:aspartic peptidase domain-containing protein [Lactarius akahatsu]